LREPDSVDLRARLNVDVTPLEVQQLLDESIQTPLRDRPHITLEEIDGDEVVVRISATPERPSEGPKLASEVLEAVSGRTVRD
jgi:small conductance mechanosensitive channel